MACHSCVSFLLVGNCANPVVQFSATVPRPDDETPTSLEGTSMWKRRVVNGAHYKHVHHPHRVVVKVEYEFFSVFLNDGHRTAS